MMIIKYTNMNQKPKSTNIIILEWALTLLVNTLVILMAASIFRGIYVESVTYAALAAAIIMILNKTLKPIVTLLTLPLTIVTLGLFYPFVNVMILKLASWVMGDAFVVEGWLVPFFVAIFISIMTIILDLLITKRIVGNIK